MTQLRIAKSLRNKIFNQSLMRHAICYFIVKVYFFKIRLKKLRMLLIEFSICSDEWIQRKLLNRFKQRAWGMMEERRMSLMSKDLNEQEQEQLNSISKEDNMHFLMIFDSFWNHTQLLLRFTMQLGLKLKLRIVTKFTLRKQNIFMVWILLNLQIAISWLEFII